ncbi:MAG: hypothetical protein DRN57_04970 [Thermoplasmata archaeon]|nr:MAG: hypothetical protein DRN57_04970 [Thermoplasmata archaeon]
MGTLSKIDLDKLGHPSLDNIDELMSSLGNDKPPSFASYRMDMGPVLEAADRMKDAENIIVIGQGGSVNTFRGLLEGFGISVCGERKFYIVDTVDPVYLREVLDRTLPANSHVIAISKSGNTLTVIEALSLFSSYPATVVTEKGYGALGKLAREKGYHLVDVPGDVGGRFSGGTASTLLPALVLGIDVNAYLDGLYEAYGSARKDEGIRNISGAFYLVERLGKRTIYIPVYSKMLASFRDLVNQLFHETLSKGRKGMTVLCFEGPECQHHTNQRVLDGPEDVATLFVLVEGMPDLDMSWGDVSTEYRGIPLTDLGPYGFGKALISEARGVMASMEEIGAPYASVTLRYEGERTAGFFVGMMQYLAYYFARLRRVNPFDQPAVENAKELALEMRKGI